MEHTRDQMDSAKPRLSNNRGDYAPYEVFAAMLHLHTDPASVVAAVSDSHGEGGRTTWRTLWLTESRIVYCEASANVSDWELASGRPHGSYEAKVDAWTVPNSAVTSVGVDAARMFQEHGTWTSDVHANLRVTDRPAIALPLFGDWPGTRQQDACDTLVRELLSRLR